MNFFSLFKRNLLYKFKKKISIDKNNFEKKTLDELFYFYGSDKANYFRESNDRGHGFSLIYEKQLNEFKNKKINILEIGSFAGASAAAFAKFFPNSKIFCFDINISNFKYFSKQINVYGLDINNKEKVKKILNKIFDQNNFEEFDLIIDDGSHLLSDIIFGFDIFFELVKSGGVYVIEDYKFPNYFQKHKDINEILVDELLKKISNQVYFSSKLFTKEKQMKIFKSIKSIDTFKGNLAESDICFIKKK